MTIDTIFVAGTVKRPKSTHGPLYRSWLAVRTWRLKRRTRQALIEMTEDQLRDIGITRSEAQREIGKSFYWD